MDGGDILGGVDIFCGEDIFGGGYFLGGVDNLVTEMLWVEKSF